jgi:uncharacterized membrane protein YdbT with pleckstrin-like domain
MEASSKAEANKVWRAANKEKEAARKKAWKKANREKEAAYQKAYREANKGKALEANKKYQKVNLEKENARKKVWLKSNPSASIINNLALKYKISVTVIRNLVPQELIEVKSLQLQLHRLIHART